MKIFGFKIFEKKEVKKEVVNDYSCLCVHTSDKNIRAWNHMATEFYCTQCGKTITEETKKVHEQYKKSTQ